MQLSVISIHKKNFLTQVSIIICIMLMFCNCDYTSHQEQIHAFSKDSTAYPYSTKNSGNWQRGEEKNIILVLSCLRKYDDGNVKEAVMSFADSIEWIGDKFDFRGKKDSFEILLSKARANLQSVSKEFDNWISVHYIDKNEDWVKLSFKEKWTDKSNHTDSVYYSVDVRLRNNKIEYYDERKRTYPKLQVNH